MMSCINITFRQQYGPCHWGDEDKEGEIGGVCPTVWGEKPQKKGTTSES